MTDTTDTSINISPDAKPATHVALRVRSVKVFKCPNCGGQISIRAAGSTLSAVCAYCSSVVSVDDESLKIIQKANVQTKPTLLEIGKRGALAGVTWEVIGYQLKSDKTGVYFWDEYLLFNPYHGFRFLVQMDGHWNYVKMLKKEFEKPAFNCEIWNDLHRFKPYLQDEPIVQYVKGEFYWRVKKGDRSKEEDYISPPYMLAFDYSDGEEVVSLCHYIEPGEVQAAFGLDHVPPRKGVAPNQPNPISLAGILPVAVVSFAVAIFIHMSIVVGHPSAQVLQVLHTHQPGDQTMDFTTEPFEMPRDGNIRVASYAPVDNQWTEIGLSLENEQTHQMFDMRQPIEYYHGYDSDGSWSEGGQWQVDYFSGIPAGSYRVVYDVDSGAFSMGQPMSIQVTMTRDVAPMSNLIITLILLALWPAFAWMRRASFETQRWQNSDFSNDG